MNATPGLRLTERFQSSAPELQVPELQLEPADQLVGYGPTVTSMVPFAERYVAPSRSGPRFPALCILLSILCLGVTIANVDPERIERFGLIDILPIAYFIGLAAVTVGFFAEIYGKRPRRTVLFVGLVVVTAYVSALAPLLYDLPRFPWTYKHVGVSRTILENGVVDRSVDIYNNWSGFFGVGAMFSGLSGTDPISTAAWAEPFFMFFAALMVGYLARSFTTSLRVVFGAMWIFTITNWIGQSY